MGTSTARIQERESNPRQPGLIDPVAADNVLFGSDYPHPQGLADPISFVDAIADQPQHQIAQITGGNLGRS